MKKITFIFFIVVSCWLSSTHAYPNDSVKISHGFLSAPLYHEKPDSPEIQIAYAKLEKPGNSKSIPIIYLVGGPGVGAVRLAERYVSRGRLPPFLETVIQHGPIYFIDQRGSGYSDPDLDCDVSDLTSKFGGGDRRAYLDQIKNLAAYCSNTVADFDYKMKALNSFQSARDIELLRKKINTEKIILLGSSYGTHLSFSYMRNFGSNVDRAILLLVEGPDHTYKLPMQFDEALARIDKDRSDDGKSELYPLIRKVLSEFEGDKEFAFIDRNADQSNAAKQSLSLFEFQLFLRFASGRKNHSFLYDVLFNRDFQTIKSRVVRSFKRSRFNGMYFAMDCASGVSKKRHGKINDQSARSILGNSINFPFPDVCDYLGIDSLPDVFRAPLKSDIPTYLFSGGLDYKTPTSNAVEVSRNLANSILVKDPKGYHYLCSATDCLSKLDEFLSGNFVK